MTVTASMTWAEQNQAVLMREFAALRRRLGCGEEPSYVSDGEESDGLGEEMEGASAIDEVTRVFGLSQFERELLLLCAGVEMESAMAERCGELTGRPQRCFVTFALAMAVLADPHWSALAPTAPLRRYRLIEMETGQGFATAPLHIDERILHYLAGVNELDQRLEGLLTRKSNEAWLSEEHWNLVKQFVEEEDDAGGSRALHLFGDDPLAQESIAALVSRRAGRALYVLRMDDVPVSGAEAEQFLTLWARESMLLPAALLLQWESETPTAAAKRLAERVAGPVVIASRDAVPLHRAMKHYEVNKAGPSGTPSPVQASQPTWAEWAPFVPLVMSRKPVTA